MEQIEQKKEELKSLRWERVQAKTLRNSLLTEKRSTAEVDKKLDELKLKTDALNAEVFAARNAERAKVSADRRAKAETIKRERAQALAGLSVAELTKRRAELTKKRAELKAELAPVVVALAQAQALEDLLKLTGDLTPEQKKLLKEQL